jgi:hypothetical protein
MEFTIVQMNGTSIIAGGASKVKESGTGKVIYLFFRFSTFALS